MSESEKIKKKLKTPNILLIIGVIIVVVLIFASGYFYLQYKKTQNLLKNPTMAAQIESQSLIAKVGMLMELPKDEQPTIATVSDITKLKGQPFFAKARNGDKVLIYSKSHQAILYDPVANKIVEVGPVNIGNQAPANPSSPAAAPVKISLYNGTGTVGLTTTVERELKDKGVNVDIVEKVNASSTSVYTKTLVIDLSGKQAFLTQQLAALLNGEVANSLPAGEKKPQNDAEILVILGK